MPLASLVKVFVQMPECAKLEAAHVDFRAGCAFPAYRDIASTAGSTGMSAMCT